MIHRLFWNIKIEAAQPLLETRDKLMLELKNEKINWTNPEHLHLTLKFLGDTPDNKIPELIHEGQSIARELSPFILKIKNLGAFYRKKYPKVLFFDIEDNQDLYVLAQKIDTACQKHGFKKEKRKFSAHLTLGRIKRLNNTGVFRQLLNWPVKAEQIHKHFYLTESYLRPEGPQYSTVREFNLE